MQHWWPDWDDGMGSVEMRRSSRGRIGDSLYKVVRVRVLALLRFLSRIVGEMVGHDQLATPDVGLVLCS